MAALLPLVGAVVTSIVEVDRGSCQLYYNATTVGVPGVTCWKWDLSSVPTQLRNTDGHSIAQLPVLDLAFSSRRWSQEPYSIR